MRKPKFSVEGKARNRLAQAEDERAAGIPDRVDSRQPFDLLHRGANAYVPCRSGGSATITSQR